jgi:hypothetical protein
MGGEHHSASLSRLAALDEFRRSCVVRRQSFAPADPRGFETPLRLFQPCPIRTFFCSLDLQSLQIAAENMVNKDEDCTSKCFVISEFPSRQFVHWRA